MLLPYSIPFAKYLGLIHFLGLFYGGYGVILCPSLGVMESYGGATPEYHNAIGFFVLSMTDTIEQPKRTVTNSML